MTGRVHGVSGVARETGAKSPAPKPRHEQKVQTANDDERDLDAPCSFFALLNGIHVGAVTDRKAHAVLEDSETREIQSQANLR